MREKYEQIGRGRKSDQNAPETRSECESCEYGEEDAPTVLRRRAIRKSRNEREVVEGVLVTKSVQPADATVMQKTGRVSGRLENDGEAVADGDVVIGATAAVVGEPVLTRNRADFDRVDCVQVKTY